MSIATLYFKRAATRWYRWYYNTTVRFDWHDLVWEIITHFREFSFTNYNVQLINFMTTNPLHHYIAKFEDLVTKVGEIPPQTLVVSSNDNSGKTSKSNSWAAPTNYHLGVFHTGQATNKKASRLSTYKKQNTNGMTHLDKPRSSKSYHKPELIRSILSPQASLR